MGKEKHIQEFDCWRETDEDGKPKTFESVAIPYPDGAGHVDYESAEECPYCGKHHWN